MEEVAATGFDAWAATLQAKLSEGLASVVRQPVALKLGHLGLIPLTEMKQYAGAESSTSIYIPLVGDLIGDIFLFMGNLEAAAMADLMMGNPVGTTSVIGEFEASALKELGNITSGVIITEMANRLKMSIILTVPNFTRDFASAVVDQVLITYAENGSEAYAMHLPFSVEGHMVSGSFLMLFDKNSFDKITATLQAPGGGNG